MLDVEAIDLYYGAAQALRRVSVTAEPGKVTCVLGRNGVGKSSLLRAIVGHQPVRAGRVVLDGQDLTPLKAYERARQGVAYVPQGREIFPLLTVRENLETGFARLPASEHAISDELFDLFPVLKSMLGRRGGDLSGGQQQQLAIARALVTKPRLLVLDEPTEGIQPSIIKDIGRALAMKPRLLILDEPTEGIQPSIIKEIERAIRALAATGEMAILLVEQYFDFARQLADSYAVMERGEVVLAGKGAEMVESDVRRYLTV